MEPMPSHKRYPHELKERAVAMVLEWRREPGTAPTAASTKSAEKLGRAYRIDPGLGQPATAPTPGSVPG